jgi:hypothetical protein
MATPEQFFKKNMKWILLVVIILFVSKFVQSCNRGMVITTMETEIVQLNDSLNTILETTEESLLLQLQECKEDVVKAEHERDIYKTRAEAAERSENNMRETLRNFKANTKITIENKSDKDTVSVNK